MNRYKLPFCTVLHVGVIFLLAYIVGQFSQGAIAFWLLMVVYWFSCWFIMFIFRAASLEIPRSKNNLKSTKKTLIFDCLPFLPVLGLVAVFVQKMTGVPQISLVLMIVVAATVNGITEEAYWRRLYCKLFYPKPLLGFLLPLILFTIWHFALLLIPGVNYDGGVLALVGGSCVLGAIWGFSYWINHSFWTIAFAHVLVNCFGFFMLANDNAWLSV